MTMDILSEWFKPVDIDARNEKIKALIAEMPLENEKLVVFFKETDEVRADLELGGLGPGLTGEHTIYSYVVGRSNVATDEDGEMDDEALKMNTNYKRWIIKKRFSHFHIFDKILLQIIKEEGGDETWLPEFPEKALFGKMSPSLVRARSNLIEFYLREIVKNPNLTRMPFVREFLKIPMNKAELDDLEEEFGASNGGVLTGKGAFKSLFQITREQKAKGIHHTQKKEFFAGPPTLAGASEVGEAFAESSVHDKKTEQKWVFRIPILADFGGQRVGDIFGDEVRGLHSTYNNKIKKQIEKSSKEKRKKDKSGKEYFITSDGYDQDGNFVG